MVARAAKDAMAPPGIPGVPTDRSTFARRITIIMEMLTLIPHALAKNMIMNDIRMDTASMFTVAPRGMAILVIVRAKPCLPLCSFSLIRKTELWETNKPPAMQVS